MAITEAERHMLVSRLIEMLGTEQTETLMKCVLPDGWQHLATKQDVEVADARLRAAFGELRGDFGELRGDFGELRGEFGELRGEFGELKGEVSGLKGYVDSALAKQTRIYLLALLGFAVTIWIALLVPAIL